MKKTLRSVAIAVALLVVATAAQAKTFAWKVTGKGGVVYLVGSVHLLSKDFYPLNPALDEFLRFILSREGQQIVLEHAAYIPLRANQVQTSRALVGK